MVMIDSWDPEPPAKTAFERSQQQIAVEERRARQGLERQVQDYARLLIELAGVFMAPELDARTRTDPDFLHRAAPADWRALLAATKAARTQGWPTAQTATAAAATRWRDEAERLQGEVTQLQAAVQLLRALPPPPASVEPPAPTPAAGAPPAPVAVPLARVPPATSSPGLPASSTDVTSGASNARDVTRGISSSTVLVPAGNRPTVGASDQAGAELWRRVATVALPPLPAQAPVRFADQLKNWEREGLALAALGTTGWSMRLAIAEVLAVKLGNVRPNAGSLRRTFDNLVHTGFWVEAKVALAGVHRTNLGAETPTTLLLVRLTAAGQNVLQAAGITPVASEWDILLAEHGGAAQTPHAALVCAFAYHARLRGYATTVCPQGHGASAPDAQLTGADATCYVEVEGASGAVEGRLAKWQNQVRLQGQVVLCAVTPAMRTSLVNEAQTAGAQHGLATDLQTLFDTQTTAGPLWVTTW